jgi:predicted dehydrogenase
MHQFKNWMWYKGLGGGPVVDYGAHQIDVLNWFLGANPKSVTARGGTNYYDPKTHEWHDTVMAILEYETSDGPVSASYRTITTNGYRGNFEVFMGDEGTLELSESPGSGGVYRDPQAPDWDKWVRLGLLGGQAMTQKKPDEGVIRVQQTQPPVSYEIPVKFDKPNHQPHLQNFFEAIRGRAELSCPAEAAYATNVAALKINEAIAANRTLDFAPEQFKI